MRRIVQSLVARWLEKDLSPVPDVLLPEGLCVYAVGDVHGETAALRSCLSRIAADFQPYRDKGGRGLLVFLGDYVDRGPDSRGVLEMLSELKAGAFERYGFQCRFLLGNHERAMLDCLAGDDPAGWLAYGGRETLASYGIACSAALQDAPRRRALLVELAQRLPSRHLAFLNELELCLDLGGYFFVHAGVRPGRPLEGQVEEDLLWIREPFLSSAANHGKVVVHGHTVVDEPSDYGNRIAVDAGAYATGLLRAAVLRGESRDFI